VTVPIISEALRCTSSWPNWTLTSAQIRRRSVRSERASSGSRSGSNEFREPTATVDPPPAALSGRPSSRTTGCLASPIEIGPIDRSTTILPAELVPVVVGVSAPGKLLRRRRPRRPAVPEPDP